MKLSNTDIQNLYNIIGTCAIANVDDILIEGGFVRGVSADRACLIISDQAVPNFGAHKVGLSRLSKLRQRLDLFMLGGKVETGVTLDAKESDRGEITQLEIACGKDKLQYRCTSTVNIKAPKSVNDSAAGIISINKQQLAKLISSVRVMGAERLSLSIKPDGSVIFQMNDANNDSCVIVNESPIEWLEQSTESVVHYYSGDVFASVIRAAGQEVALSIGAAGSITVLVNDHPLTLLPQIGDENE
jgi:hypothetical protein